MSRPMRKPIVVAPDGGRAYPMGRIRAVFKADRDETAEGYSVSEWWLEPRTRGPGVHQHDEDHVFYVIAGTVSVYAGDAWSEVPAGGYVVIPGGAPHDFQNRGEVRAGFIAFTTPGGFEDSMANVQPALAAENLSL